MNISPINQTSLYGLGGNLLEFINLFENNKLPNKILLSGEKGLGKSTLAYHLINYVLSKNEKFSYDKINFKINEENVYFKLTINNTNPNLFLVDITNDKKNIDIGQIRNLIINLNKSSFNIKPRFVLIDNIDFMNTSSVNALLKVLEEPNEKTYFILINNNRNILPTLKSRCLNYKIYLSKRDITDVTNNLLKDDIKNYVNDDLLSYYFTPGNIYNLVNFAMLKQYDLTQYDLNNFLKLIIKENLYKKDTTIRYMIFDFFELYLRKKNFAKSLKLNNYYSYFLKRISDIKKFNLDEESLFTEFEYKMLNG